MRTTISATELRVRDALALHAAAEGWPIPPRLLGRIAKLAAHAAGEPRPSDGQPRGRGKGRKGREKPPEGPSGPRNPLADGPARSGAATDAPEAVSAIRGAR